MKRNFNKRKVAFTLSEVLITIGILGIIAMLVLPSILGKSSKNKALFRKSYYTLNQVVNNVINSDVDYPAEQTITLVNPNDATKTIDYQRLLNYTDSTTNGSTNKFCFLLSNAMKTKVSPSCPSSSGNGYGNWQTTDNMNWKIYIPISDSTNIASVAQNTAANSTSFQFPINMDLYTTKLIIDVNGDNSPNCTNDTTNGSWGLARCSGNATMDPDQFIIGVRYDGRLQVGCSTKDSSCSTPTDQSAIDTITDPKNNSKS